MTEIRRVFLWNTWYLNNRSIRLRIKGGCRANMIANIPSTEGTLGNVKK